MDEATCPFCHKAIRSDADAPEFCALCGMGIYHADTSPSLNGLGGKKIYFCCSSCPRIYTRIRKGDGCHRLGRKEM